MWNSRFPPADFQTFFRQHGERVLLYRAVPCPCGNQPGGPSNINCQACGGLGRFYPDPPVTTRMVLTQVTQRQTLEAYGELIPGDMVADQPPHAPQLSILDIVLPTWSRGEPYEGDEVARGTTASDSLTYRAQEVFFCGTVDPATGASTAYVQGVDFSVAGKAITWLTGGSAPSAGALYAVRYNAQFEWSPWLPGQVRYERGTNLGQRTALRKRHLALQTISQMVASG